MVNGNFGFIKSHIKKKKELIGGWRPIGVWVFILPLVLIQATRLKPNWVGPIVNPKTIGIT